MPSPIWIRAHPIQRVHPENLVFTIMGTGVITRPVFPRDRVIGAYLASGWTRWMTTGTALRVISNRCRGLRSQLFVAYQEREPRGVATRTSYAGEVDVRIAIYQFAHRRDYVTWGIHRPDLLLNEDEAEVSYDVPSWWDDPEEDDEDLTTAEGRYDAAFLDVRRAIPPASSTIRIPSSHSHESSALEALIRSLSPEAQRRAREVLQQHVDLETQRIVDIVVDPRVSPSSVSEDVSEDYGGEPYSPYSRQVRLLPPAGPREAAHRGPAPGFTRREPSAKKTKFPKNPKKVEPVRPSIWDKLGQDDD